MSQVSRWLLGLELPKKTKHVQLRSLFIQELVASGVVSIKKVSGIISNPSDVMTKYTSRRRPSYCMCTSVEFHTSHVCTYFSSALPVTVLDGLTNFILLETSSENLDKLSSRTAAFTLKDPTSYFEFRFLSLHCHGPWTHGLRTDWFFVRCNFKPDAILANVVNLHFMFFANGLETVREK